HEMLLFCGLFAMIISILHVIGHTRKEEDLGLTELVRSFQVGRQANSFAAIAEVVFINVILALFIAGVMVSFSGYDIYSRFLPIWIICWNGWDYWSWDWSCDGTNYAYFIVCNRVSTWSCRTSLYCSSWNRCVKCRLIYD